MSWTSEHEPPLPRPSIETDDSADQGFGVAEPSTDGGADDFPDEGPLDPSVFDGLFADLGDPPESPSESPTTAPVDDEPTGPVQIVDLDADFEFDLGLGIGAGAGVGLGVDEAREPSYEPVDPSPQPAEPSLDDIPGLGPEPSGPPSNGSHPQDFHPQGYYPDVDGSGNDLIVSDDETAERSEVAEIRQPDGSYSSTGTIEDMAPELVSRFDPVEPHLTDTDRFTDTDTDRLTDADRFTEADTGTVERWERNGTEAGAVESNTSFFDASTTMPGVEPETWSDAEISDRVSDDPAGLLDRSPAGRTSDIYHGPEPYRQAPLVDPVDPTPTDRSDHHQHPSPPPDPYRQPSALPDPYQPVPLVDPRDPTPTGRTDPYQQPSAEPEAHHQQPSAQPEAHHQQPSAQPEAHHQQPSAQPEAHHQPAFQPDPHRLPAGVPSLRPAERETDDDRFAPDRRSADEDSPTRRRWPAFALATVVGAIFGIGGAVLLAQAIGVGDGSVETTSPIGGEEAASAQDTPDGADSDQDPAGPVATVDVPVALGPVDRLELNTLRFEPGTDRLSEDSTAALDLLAQAIEQRPGEPIAVTVRTYTERTAAADLALSESQAAALSQQLVERGANPDQLTVTGLGRSLLTPAQPVASFVVPSAGLAVSDLRSTLENINPFAIGLDSVNAQLRPESREPLAQIAEAMAGDPGSHPITLSAYSYGEADTESNRKAARAAAVAAADHLTATYGIEGSRLNIIVLGDAPYGITSEIGNHIGLRWGDLAAGSVALGAVPVDQIDFAPASVSLSVSAEQILDQLLDIVVGTESAVVVDVHSFDGDDEDANHELSEERAAAIADYLTGAGLSPSRLRVHGRGARPQFHSENEVARIVVSVVPWAG